ncbi:hypothetical protein [Actinokineospora iranica]|uniref:PPE family protein n=1 Tax=Actinokineospora iranica TaxID=1271860 RepID=A0A1G6YF22_9PSEU|nr:hypothetical protein [Actinokineospora iranica]SDD88205.1 hypothetical protein SAMN05216174_12118 [Actinokineospora iranica]
MGPKPVVNEVGSVRSQGDLRAEVEQQVDRELRNRYGDGLFGELMAQLHRESMVNDQVRDRMAAEAGILSQGGHMRAAPSIPGMNYLAIPHSDLKNNVMEDADPGEVGRVGDAWVGLGEWMIGFQRQFSGAIAASESTWEGTSGTAARQFMADVGNYVGQAGTSAQLAGRQAQLHADALSTARAMPDPVDFDVDAANAELGTITDPVERATKYEEHMATYERSQRAHEEAAQVASGYDQSMAGASTMPAFATPPVMGAGSTPPVEPPGPPSPPPKSREPGGAFVPSQVAGPSSVGTGGPDSVTSVPPAAVSAQGFEQGQANQAGRPITSSGRPGEFSPPLGGLPIAGLGGGDQQADRRGAGRGAGPGGPRQGSAGGFGAGARPSGGFGPRGGSGFGPGTGGPGPGTGGPGPTAGGPRAGAGALAAEHAAGRGGGPAGGGSAGGGRGGAGGMGGGGGAGQGGEDTEHQRPSYLVEADPDDLFGTDEITAPPVIGQ